MLAARIAAGSQLHAVPPRFDADELRRLHAQRGQVCSVHGHNGAGRQRGASCCRSASALVQALLTHQNCQPKSRGKAICILGTVVTPEEILISFYSKKVKITTT